MYRNGIQSQAISEIAKWTVRIQSHDPWLFFLLTDMIYNDKVKSVHKMAMDGWTCPIRSHLQCQSCNEVIYMDENSNHVHDMKSWYDHDDVDDHDSTHDHAWIGRNTYVSNN